MIGLFDSGHGGLTIMRALAERFPQQSLLYIGDHANAPYGNRSNQEIVQLTQQGVETLFERGAKLVILACNTATAIATRTLQQEWLPTSRWQQHNILGIVAPTVEAATQVPWAVTTPQYPQKHNTDCIAVFATTGTVASQVYPDEILKRCPEASIIQQACPELAGAIESGADKAELENQIKAAVESMLMQTPQNIPHRAILGCTHYSLVHELFRKHLPPQTRLLSQPEIVAHSLEDYLSRHTHFGSGSNTDATLSTLTSGDIHQVNKIASHFWPEAPGYSSVLTKHSMPGGQEESNSVSRF